eukprot:11370373-Heterocapsa_arctica.AAC.1
MKERIKKRTLEEKIAEGSRSTGDMYYDPSRVRGVGRREARVPESLQGKRDQEGGDGVCHKDEGL